MAASILLRRATIPPDTSWRKTHRSGSSLTTLPGTTKRSNTMASLANAHLGITPTGWTNDDLPTVGEHIPFEQCISEIALAGYEGCSIGHKYPTNASVL